MAHTHGTHTHTHDTHDTHYYSCEGKCSVVSELTLPTDNLREKVGQKKLGFTIVSTK